MENLAAKKNPQPDQGVCWKPHKTFRTRVVCSKKHVGAFGRLIFPGYQISFLTHEMRNKWLAAHYPKRYAKLRPQ